MQGFFFFSSEKKIKVFTSPRLKEHQSVEIIFSSCLSYLNFHQHYLFSEYLRSLYQAKVDAGLKKEREGGEGEELIYIYIP